MSATLVPTAWTTGTTEVFRTGSWRSSVPEYVAGPSPCHLACPAGGEIAEWMARAREGDWRVAWEVLVRHNPFPAIAGRVCHHPCESACNRAAWDQPLAVCEMERTIGDLALAHRWELPAAPPAQDGHVAVIGAGPSGLAAAYHLRRRGWRVTLYEAGAAAGGVMRHGIPDYRLPRDVLDGEIDRILAMGVDLVCGAPVRSPEDLRRLRATHDAVYVATGAGRARRLPQLPAAAPWCMDGRDFLLHANAGARPALGRRLLVVGGGSAAIDVARSARRLGHEVTLLALEAREELPAQAEEVAEALEEGVHLVAGAMLCEVAEGAGGGLAVRCQRVRLVRAQPRGAFQVEALPDTGFTVGADAVVPAIGQDPDLAPFADLPAAGALLASDARQASAAEGVWAGGDVASMARFVTEAVGMGKRAAIDIDRALRNRDRDTAARPSAVTADAIATWYHPKSARVAERRLPAAERLGSGAEVQLGIGLAEAQREASRCFSCGLCTSCDNCFQYCPDLAIVHRPEGGYAVLTDYCKGCGVCVRECPTGAITLKEELR